MQVVLLLVLVWAAVLVPPAVRAHRQRRAEFVSSFDRSSVAEAQHRAVRARTRVTTAQRRRQILGGLLVAMVVTLVGGLLPPLRVLLVVHLFLVDSFLGYVTMLVHLRRRAEAAPARSAAFGPEPSAARRSPLDVVGRARMPGLPPLAGAWRE